MKRGLLFITTAIIFLVTLSCDADLVNLIEQDVLGTGPLPTYTVTYSGNGSDGGTVPTDNNQYEEGESVTAAGVGTMTLSNNSFIGWNTNIDGSGIDIPAGSNFSMVAYDLILFAQWTVDQTYNVTYFGNGNDGGIVPSDSNNYTQGSTVIVAVAGTMSQTGHTFTGWNTEQNGSGISRPAGSSFTMGTSSVTLWAQWIVTTYRVTYNGNENTSGTVPIDSATYREGDTVTVLGNSGELINIDGATTAYYFTGWNTSPLGSGENYSGGDVFSMGTSNITLYAEWTPYGLLDLGPAGGKIFYDKGHYSEGWRYLEAAPSDQSTGTDWGCYGTAISGADGTEIGTGKQNTLDIVADCATSGTAAAVCATLTSGGYSDWFLPSLDEMLTMSEEITGFSGNSYWSSSEYSATHAWKVDPLNALSGTYRKNIVLFKVRAARSF